MIIENFTVVEPIFNHLNPTNGDFYCPRIKLFIEVDGSIHNLPGYQEHNSGRSDDFKNFGITVIRFTNEQIIYEIDYTVKQILDQVN